MATKGGSFYPYYDERGNLQFAHKPEEKQPEASELKKFYVKDARLVRRQLPDDVVNHNGVHFHDTFEVVLGPYGGITQDDVAELMRLIETETPVILVPVKHVK